MKARRAWGLRLLVLTGLMASPLAGAAAGGAGYHVPLPVSRTLANGLTVAVFQDDRLPIVQIQLLVAAGAVHEPSGESGVANLTFQMLGAGTASRTAEEFNAALEALGASVGGTASREFTAVNGSFLAGDFEAGLELLADAVVHPIFPDDQLMAVKSQLAGTLTRVRQNPATVADEHLWSAVFPGHPYARTPLGATASVSTLGMSTIRAFQRNRYRPDGALLAIAGDVSPERAFPAAEELLGSWGGHTRDVPTAVLPPPATAWRVRIVDVPGLARAELCIGTPGPARNGSDFDALTLGGELLAAVPDAGLRVGVSGLREAGLVSIAGSVPVESVGVAVASWRAAITRWTAETPGEGALATARGRLTGAFTLQFETLGGRIAQWAAATFHALPGEALAGYQDRIASVSAAAVHAAVARWVSPDHMVLVAVGPAAPLRAQLEAIGPIEVVSAEAAAEAAEIPSTAPPTPEQMVKGRSLAAQAAVAHGGLARLRGILDSSIEGDIVMTPASRPYTGRLRQLRKEPDRFLFSTTFQYIVTVQGLDGRHGWGQLGAGAEQLEDLDSVGVAGLKAGFRSDLQHLLLSAADTTSRVAWRGQERRDERDTDVIEVVAADGDRRLLFLDVGTHQLVAMEQNEAGHSTRRLYRDLRPVDGVLWPFSEERLLDGQQAMTLALSRVAFNTGLKDSLFRKPRSGPAADPVAPPRRPRPR